ncbi:MAG: protein TolR [Rhodanobacter sp.]|jgi:biopolymer transport protein TolR|nr:protein TolR [Rhodanobacter sp.]
MSTPRRQKRYKLKSEINVVPYIDVMLVLLIIFMVTTPMLNSSVDVQLPQANAKSLQQKKDPVLVSVLQDGQLYLTLSGARKELVDEDTLKVKVGAFVRQNPEVSVLVGGDKRGTYGGVFKVLADLQQAGVAKVGLMGQPNAPDNRGKSTSDGRK